MATFQPHEKMFIQLDQGDKQDFIIPIHDTNEFSTNYLGANELQNSRDRLSIIIEEDGATSDTWSEEDDDEDSNTPLSRTALNTMKDSQVNNDKGTSVEMTSLGDGNVLKSFKHGKDVEFAFTDKFRNRSQTAPNLNLKGHQSRIKEKNNPQSSKNSLWKRSFQKIRKNLNLRHQPSTLSQSSYNVRTPISIIKEGIRCGIFRMCLEFACSSPSKYRIKKAILGFLFGITLVLGIFVAVHFSQYDFEKSEKVEAPSTWTYGAGAGFALLLALGLTFCYGLRCITLLMLPALFTTRGRAMILALIIQLLLIGPIKNTTDNARLVGESTSCQIQLLVNQTDELLQTLINQTNSVVDGYKALLNASLKTYVDNIKDNLKKINDIVKPLGIIDYTLQIHGVNVSRHDFEGYSNEINFSRYYDSPRVSTNKSFTVLREILEEHFTSRLKYIEKIVGVLRQVIPWSILLVFIQSVMYRRGYLSQIEYDNIYVTKQFKLLDKERKKARKRQTLIPLKKREKSNLIDSTSCLLSPRERGSLAVALGIFIVFMLIGAFIVSIDYGLYFVMSLVRAYGNSTLLFNGGLGFTVTPGEDISPNIRKLLMQELPSLFNNNNTNLIYDSSIETMECLPNPLQPSIYNDAHVIILSVLYILLFVVSLLQAYGLRLQHKVSAFFYPEQEEKRVVYLYHSIRSQRVSVKKLLYQKLKRKLLKKDKSPDDITFSDHFLATHPVLRKILQKTGIIKNVDCDSCGSEIYFGGQKIKNSHICCECSDSFYKRSSV